MSKPDKNGWRPIADAPKDGRDFLAFHPDLGCVVMRWPPYAEGPHTAWNEVPIRWLSHWQPLPDAPEFGE